MSPSESLSLLVTWIQSVLEKWSKFLLFSLSFTNACCRGYREHLIWCGPRLPSFPDWSSSEGCRWFLSPCQNQTSPACLCGLVFTWLLIAGVFRFPGSDNASSNLLPQRQLHRTSEELQSHWSKESRFIPRIWPAGPVPRQRRIIDFLNHDAFDWGLLWYGAVVFAGPGKWWSSPCKEQGEKHAVE